MQFMENSDFAVPSRNVDPEMVGGHGTASDERTHR